MIKEEIVDFIIIVLRCFLILLFFGILLPKIIEILLNGMNYNLNFRNNTKFVNYTLSEKRSIANNYLDLFYSLLGLK